MKRLLLIPAGGLILLIGVAVIGRAASAPSSSERCADRSTSPAVPEAPVEKVRFDGPKAPSAPASSSPEAVRLAGSLERELLAIRDYKVRWKAKGMPIPADEHAEARGKARRAQLLGRELARRLYSDPGEWPALLEWLLALENEEVAGRIAFEIGGALNGPSRDILMERARSAKSPRARIIALRLLAADAAPAGLPAVLHAVQSDEEASVRRAALGALSKQLGRMRDSDDVLLAGQVLATRAEVDPDEEVRRAARALSDRIEDRRQAPGTATLRAKGSAGKK